MPTGLIRPTNGVYGTGVHNSSSLTWDYLRRGGGPTWLTSVVQPFVNAQNVSIGHLAFEKALLDKKPGVAGKGYCVTDPNPPIIYRDLYLAMTTLAHPLARPKFPQVPFMPMYLLSHLVEWYKMFRHQYMPSLPPPKGDIALLQPGVFKVCTAHMVFPDNKAREEIDYRAAFGTLEGVALALVDWNRDVEAKAQQKIEKGKGGEVKVSCPLSNV